MSDKNKTYFNSDKIVLTTVIMLLLAIGLVAFLMSLIGDSSKEPEAYGNNGPVEIKSTKAFSSFMIAKNAQADDKQKDETKVSVTEQAEITPVTPALDQDAIATFALSLEVDDPRAPPINRSQPEVPVAQEILDDPVLYAEHEAQNRRVLLQSYVVAAKEKVQRLNLLIAQGKARGISPEKLSEGLGKVAALEAGIEQISREL